MGRNGRSRARGVLMLAVAWVVVGFAINAAMVVAIQTWGSALNGERRASASPEKYSVFYATGFGIRSASRIELAPGLQKSVPAWVRLDQQRIGTFHVGGQYAVGWPFLACSAWRGIDPAKLTAGHRPPHHYPIVTIPFTASLPGGREAQIPLDPMWRGLIANTAILGSPALLVFVPAVRARRRRRKGKCPRCAYDLKHDFAHGCSECGWNKHAARC
ncbi:MAG: hypothetical protein ACTS27_08835 [Phycisphaerales bacterium]